MGKKQSKSESESTRNDLEEALSVKSIAFSDLDVCDLPDRPKHVDAYVRAANVVRQLEKDRKKAVASFSDDEIIQHVRSLPERRREAILTAVQGTSLAGKPLYP